MPIIKIKIKKSKQQEIEDTNNPQSRPLPVSKEYAGVLEDWYFIGDMLWGRIKEDCLGRFEPNKLIHTSYVVSLEYNTQLSHGWVETRNSTYSLQGCSVRKDFPHNIGNDEDSAYTKEVIDCESI